MSTTASLFDVTHFDSGLLAASGSLSLDDAVASAEQLLDQVPLDAEATYVVTDSHGRVLASITNRRIIGRFLKQTWGGRKGDVAMPCGDLHFDATDYILMLNPDDVRRIEDNAETSDEIGLGHVVHNGPFEVTISESICAYFGVSALEDITDEAFAHARNKACPQPPVVETVTLAIKVRLSVAPGQTVSEFIENLDYSIVSNTAGVRVLDTEIVDA